MLDAQYFFHGTDTLFGDITFPIPRSNSCDIYHSGLFFTSNKKYAQEIGDHLLKIRITKDAKILDFTNDYGASESIRQSLANNHIYKLSENVKYDIWHNGWKDGSILRIMIAEIYMNIFKSIMLAQDLISQNKNISYSDLIHNATRKFIEQICITVKNLGYDGAYGYENHVGLKDPIPLLVIFNENAVKNSSWLY